MTALNTTGIHHPKLDPTVRTMLQAGPAMPDLRTLTPAEFRAMPLLLQPAPEVVARIVQRSIPSPGGWIRLRIYWPEGPGPHPALVYLHGGGWVVGSIDGSDRFCRDLTNAAGAVIISVDYRLSPETKFPGALDDTMAVLSWTRDAAAELQVDAARIGVGGMSAGGNLAAAAALVARDRGALAIGFQLLIVPVLDRRCDSLSMREYADGPSLTADAMRWFWEQYLERPEDGASPYASVAEASDLRALPPALVVTAGCDPLCSEGEAYAERLREAGVDATVRRYDGMPHGFLGFAGLDAAKRAMTEIGESIRAHL